MRTKPRSLPKILETEERHLELRREHLQSELDALKRIDHLRQECDSMYSAILTETARLRIGTW